MIDADDKAQFPYQAGYAVHVNHAEQNGTVLFISAAIHGDELNGIEIVRRILATMALRRF